MEESNYNIHPHGHRFHPLFCWVSKLNGVDAHIAHAIATWKNDEFEFDS